MYSDVRTVCKRSERNSNLDEKKENKLENDVMEQMFRSIARQSEALKKPNDVALQCVKLGSSCCSKPTWNLDLSKISTLPTALQGKNCLNIVLHNKPSGRNNSRFTLTVPRDSPEELSACRRSVEMLTAVQSYATRHRTPAPCYKRFGRSDAIKTTQLLDLFEEKESEEEEEDIFDEKFIRNKPSSSLVRSYK